MRQFSLIFTALTLLTSVNGFKFMAKWNMPTREELMKAEAVKDQFGDRKLVIVTGTSSGLGRKAALALLRTGQYHVVGAVRDLDKMEAICEMDEYPMEHFTPMQCELNSFESVRKFCDDLKEWKGSKNVDRLICNAGVYQPTLPYAKWSADGHEQTMQINYLSHFLMISELLEDMSKVSDARVTLVGSVTGNDNTVGGGGVYPIADLKDLKGFEAGFENPVAMADGYGFIGAKAYKDSKLCLMMLSNTLHAKYHKKTGINFSSIYPGCIAESPLFREKRDWFRKYFPIFMKYITGGFVGEEEAGQRLFQVAHDPRCAKSGVYWSWNGGPREGRGAEALEKDGQISGSGGAGGGWDSIFENDQSGKVNDIDMGFRLFDASTKITGAEWPVIKTITSPCPTLKVVGAISAGMIEKEELKRMSEMPGFDATTGEVINKPKITKRQKTKLVAQKVVGFGVRNTLGRVGGFLNRRLLGHVPETALTGSYQEEKPLTVAPVAAAQVTEPVQVAAAAPAVKVTTSPQQTVTVVKDEITAETPEIFKTDTQLIQEAISNEVFEKNGKEQKSNVMA